MALSVPVEDTVENGLRKLCSCTQLQGEDRYACEACFAMLSEQEKERHNAMLREHNMKTSAAKRNTSAVEEKKSFNCLYSDAVMSTSISRLGGTLALHLLRFHCKGRDFQKITRSVSFPTSLDLSPFVCNDLLHENEEGYGFSVLQGRFPDVQRGVLHDVWDSAGHYLPEAERLLTEASKNGQLALVECTSPTRERRFAEENFSSDIKRQNSPDKDHVDTSILWVPTNIGTSSASNTSTRSCTFVSRPPPTALKRSLVGIVVHRGSLHSGHYIAFVRDARNTNCWFRCDDENVERVDEKTVLQCKSDVYMLFYE